jgi:RHS repeat-associated protein
VRVGPAGAPRVETWLTYEDATRVTVRTDALNGRSFTTGYHYDERDNLDEITYPSGRKVQYDFDSGNRLTHVNGPDNNPVWAHSFSYHVSGGLAGYTARNGQTTAITYEEAAGTRRRYWPRRVQSGPVDLTYGYDSAANVDGITDSRGAGFSQGFGYDNVDRLTAVTDFGAQTFEYDARGNRTRKNGVIHQYHAQTDRLTSDGVTTYGYDAAGNLTTAGSATYTYTPYNLLETATVDGAQTTYRYDADNQRRMREGPTGTEYFVAGPGLLPLAEYREHGGQAVLVREYLYAGARLIAAVEAASTVAFGEAIVAGQTLVKAEHLAELRREVNNVRVVYGLPRVTWVVDPGETAADLQGRLIRYPHINEVRAALTAIAPHNFGVDLQAGNPILAAHFNGIRDRINQLRAGGERYYHLDALGSVRAVTDSTGATLRRHDYQPFGEEINPQGGSDARRFTEKERDAETGLDYFSARFLGGNNGRFTTTDPAQVTDALLDPQQWNKYAYARGNPLKFRDPLGAAVELIGSEADRERSFNLLLEAVGPDAAKYLYIDRVDGRYFVGIIGDVGDFMRLNKAAHALANLVLHQQVVEFQVTTKSLAREGGSYTYEPGETGNPNTRVLVNPQQVIWTWLPTVPLTQRYFEGQNEAPRWIIRNMTPGIAAWHELGHAWGNINGRSIKGGETAQESVDWENLMRGMRYGPLGPRNAPRRWH